MGKLVNRKELARRIARKGGYEVGEIDNVLKLYEDVFEEAVRNGEEIKQGKLFKVYFQELAEKRAYNGLEKTYFLRHAKLVPKIKWLVRLQDTSLSLKKENADS